MRSRTTSSAGDRPSIPKRCSAGSRPAARTISRSRNRLDTQRIATGGGSSQGVCFMLPLRATLLLLALPVVAPGSPAPSLRNPDFEGDEVGKPPRSWQLTPRSREQGFRVQVSAQQPRQGQRCVELVSTKWPVFGTAGLVVQSVPAAALRGKRVRFRAAVRAEVNGGWQNAALSIRVLRPEGRPGHFAEMAENPVTSARWVQVAVVADVADDAEQIEVGFLLNSMGKAWF